MNLRAFVADTEAVSPVVGVMLMVSITVVLAAVVGTFALGFGTQLQDNPPIAQIDFEYFQNGTGNYGVNVTHGGGQQINNETVFFRPREKFNASHYQGGAYEAGDTLIEQTKGTGDTAAGELNSEETVQLIWSNSESRSTILVRSAAPTE